jgi:hypothetical protein
MNAIEVHPNTSATGNGLLRSVGCAATCIHSEKDIGCLLSIQSVQITEVVQDVLWRSPESVDKAALLFSISGPGLNRTYLDDARGKKSVEKPDEV